MSDTKNSTLIHPFFVKYALSCIAACVAETVTYPLDLTKTRLQIQGERGLTTYRGMTATALGIARQEGVWYLWQGVSPALYRHLIYTGCRITSYERIRDVLGKNEDNTFPLWKSIIAGMSAGGMSQFLASPMDRVKVIMQMQGLRRLKGEPIQVKNVADAFKKTLKSNGIRALWKGWVPNVQRAMLVNLGDLTTYDTTKHQILKRTNLKDGPFIHTLSSICAGLSAALLSTPADVIKTRIMNQSIDENGRGLLYKSSFDCLSKTVQNEGFAALYKGFVPIWVRMAPWSLTFWLTYEQIRRLSRVQSF
ncbi:unnamed protein product [Didymodactylos carnosus]|uniref:Mitochondrial uncoupling protein 4 n=1 Tax=Didymodactylos carnosus TaxID=1234261 RepID=A0A813RCS1_9BILA|nr:unnamed protein product [Didymodactylos carnosus]CAF0858813.1 unnamed protein product [Didymodactylos carnosus]CAF3563330.1 unnamed protein product [Didymodactylos carnosus]CAF3643794.1 unnamed protein product [Didymodactylos carnosus]